MKSALGLCLLIVAACAPSRSEPFLASRAAAERAYAAGRYDEAAEHWRAAEGSATVPRDKTEARYRRASSLRRAGRHAEAAELLRALLAEKPKSARAARARFDLADIEIESGDQAKGWAELEAAVRAHPGSGLAPKSLLRLAQRHEERGGPDAGLAYLERMRRELGETELAERAQFAYAKKLHELERHEQALAAYLEQVRRFPYPSGALWDDALWYASELEQKLGRPERAVRHLETMLAEREPSSLQGSYERPRYAAARFRIAELCRDELRDPARARKEFRRVWDEHPTSPLGDDALWNEARLAKAAGDQARACSTLELLTKRAADSRYAPCVRALCAELTPAKGECHAYVVRELEGKAEPEGE